MEQRRSRSPMSRKSSKSPEKNKPERIFPNRFLNFLTHFRKSNKQLSVVEIAKRGGELWRGMSEEDKLPFTNLARQAPKYAYRRRTRRQYRSRSRGRRRHYSSSSSEETNKSVERPRIKPEIKYVHPRKHEKDRETVREPNSEKYDEVQQNSNEGDVEFQGSGPSGSLENRESRKDNNATEMRLKSADYDDIRRDYI